MKVTMRITIEIDAAEWSAEYGIDKKEVREDVRRYVATALHAMPITPTAVEVK